MSYGNQPQMSAGAYNPGADVPVCEPTLGSRLGMLTESISSLGVALDNLTSKLQPVLTAQPPSNAKESSKIFGGSPAMQAVDEERERVAHLHERVMELVRRLAL